MKGIFVERNGGKLSSIEEGDFLFFLGREVELVREVGDNGVYAERILLNTSLETRDALPYVKKRIFYEVGADGILSPVAGGETLESIPCRFDPRRSVFERYVKKFTENRK